MGVGSSFPVEEVRKAAAAPPSEEMAGPKAPDDPAELFGPGSGYEPEVQALAQEARQSVVESAPCADCEIDLRRATIIGVGLGIGVGVAAAFLVLKMTGGSGAN